MTSKVSAVSFYMSKVLLASLLLGTDG